MQTYFTLLVDSDSVTTSSSALTTELFLLKREKAKATLQPNKISKKNPLVSMSTTMQQHTQLHSKPACGLAHQHMIATPFCNLPVATVCGVYTSLMAFTATETSIHNPTEN